MNLEWTVSEQDAGDRLDLWLARRITDLSRSRIQNLIIAGLVSCDGRAIKKGGARVRAGMKISVDLPEKPRQEKALLPEPIPLDVAYEDADIIVVNKPAGLVVHPACGHESGTLVNALLFRCGDLAGIGGTARPGIVHRLDKDTSGLLVAAKNDPAMAALARQFKAGRVLKEYEALIWGAPKARQGRIETLIGRNPADRKLMSSRVNRGRRAVTNYEIIQTVGPISVVRLRIETGRTHQIRVHMAHIGHPVVGDPQYGGRRRQGARGIEAARQMLHARRLGFLHPRTGLWIEFTTDLPADILAVLERARNLLSCA